MFEQNKDTAFVIIILYGMVLVCARVYLRYNDDGRASGGFKSVGGPAAVIVQRFDCKMCTYIYSTLCLDQTVLSYAFPT